MIKENKFHLSKKSLRNFPTDGSKLCKLKVNDLEDETRELGLRLGELQEVIYAEAKQKILIVLQGLDTSGKDGTVKHVFSETNPQGIRVVSFKQPTDLERQHDYLWRLHKQTPALGEMVIFNRSHYEDYVIPAVHQTLPSKQVDQRLRDINHFEEMLVSEGVTLFKFFLHISRKEQAKRIQDRLNNPKKHWKFSLSDLKERQHWNRYLEAYDTVIKKTHHKDRPWDVIPADDKKIRNYEISNILVQRLEKLKPKFPVMDARVIRKIKLEAAKILRS